MGATLPGHMMQGRQPSQRNTNGDVGKSKGGEERELGRLPHTHTSTYLHSQSLSPKFNPLACETGRPAVASDKVVSFTQMLRRQEPNRVEIGVREQWRK